MVPSCDLVFCESEILEEARVASFERPYRQKCHETGLLLFTKPCERGVLAWASMCGEADARRKVWKCGAQGASMPRRGRGTKTDARGRRAKARVQGCMEAWHAGRRMHAGRRGSRARKGAWKRGAREGCERARVYNRAQRIRRASLHGRPNDHRRIAACI